MVSLSIVIVNWNAGHDLAAAVDSIAHYHHNIVSAVIIVDNASTDDSLSQVDALANLPFQIQILRNDTNRGFAAACNQGAALSKSEYLLFLNPDTRLFEKSLSVPLEFMQQMANERVGICGIQLIDKTGKISRSCARFPSILMFVAQTLGLTKLQWFQSWSHHMEEWDHATTCQVDHVIGAFYLIRRSLFEALNGFDEQFFVYLEDLDLSFRAHKVGWKSIFIANAQAFHEGGGTSQKVKANRLFYSLRSRVLYGFKHFSLISAALLLVLTLLIEPFSRLVFSFLRGARGDVRNTLTAYAMLWRALPSIVRSELNGN